MDSWLAEVYAFRALGLQLFIKDQNAVEPKPRAAFFFVLGPMNVHRELVPFTGGEISLPVRAVSPQVPRTVSDSRSAAFFRLDPPCHNIVVFRRRGSFPIEKIVAVLGWLGHIHMERHV